MIKENTQISLEANSFISSFSEKTDEEKNKFLKMLLKRQADRQNKINQEALEDSIIEGLQNARI
jgi:hypothetical protein